MEQQRFLFDYGVTPEQACIMCHFSSECGGCCEQYENLPKTFTKQTGNEDRTVGG